MVHRIIAKNSKPNLIIAGATGYIGQTLLSRAKDRFSVYGTSSSGSNHLLRLRLGATNEFNYDKVKSLDVIILCAAISAPDVCAREHDHAWATNVTGTSDFIENIIARSGRVIFFSSDTVYGERENEFDEDAASNPAGEYAVMKNEVERKFAGNPYFKSVRLSYVFSRKDKFTKYLVECAQRAEEAELFHPFFRAIIHRDDVVDGALALAQHWDEFPQQIINFGGPQVLSRIDFAEYLKQTCLPTLKYYTTKPEEDFFKNRPKIIAMKSDILPKLLGRPCRSLKEAAAIEFAKN